ncbi:MAG: hypothetical protein RLZZ126_221 [Pseudomonadota bacterium]|jgi:hypothetical protein
MTDVALRLLMACLVGLGCVFTSLAGAATFMVDDSQSTVLDAHLPLQWRSLSPSGGDHIVQGATRVQIRLDTSAWVGRPARIYMVLAPQPNGLVTAQWQTQGALLPGSVTSGQRGLVWSGVVPATRMEDVMAVVIRADGRLVSSAQLLRFHFEIDLP